MKITLSFDVIAQVRHWKIFFTKSQEDVKTDDHEPDTLLVQ